MNCRIVRTIGRVINLSLIQLRDYLHSLFISRAATSVRVTVRMSFRYQDVAWTVRSIVPASSTVYVPYSYYNIVTLTGVIEVPFGI